jgi:hypothetical protein
MQVIVAERFGDSAPVERQVPRWRRHSLPHELHPAPFALHGTGHAVLPRPALGQGLHVFVRGPFSLDLLTSGQFWIALFGQQRSD